MKKCFIVYIIFFLSPAISRAEGVVYDYPAYYATFKNSIFKEGDQKELEGELVTWAPDINSGKQADVKDAQLRFSWSGSIAGKEHFISVGDDTIAVDGHDIAFRSARIFSGDEVSSYRPVGTGPILYIGKTPYACVEGNNSNGSTGGRYMSVYLFNFKHPASEIIYKLPSLFASCLNIRLDEKQNIVFDKASYHNNATSGRPDGVVFDEYTIDNGNFKLTRAQVFTRFIEPGNVYKFIILKTPGVSQ